MLQFLQYKVFGQHRVPDGWIVVTAGNPPEYNKSVREFDIVTWDRLKRIDVEPDYEAWKEYAYKKGVHNSILTYLAAKKKDYYTVESTVDGKQFVTVRSWDDLGEMIYLYERHNLSVDEKLICQYLQNRRIAKDFAIYYNLYIKYRSDYQVEAILEGAHSESIVARAQGARFDERLSLLGLLLGAVTAELREVVETEDMIRTLQGELKGVYKDMTDQGADVVQELEERAEKQREILEKGRRTSSLSPTGQRMTRRVIAALEEYRANIIQSGIQDSAEAFDLIKAAFERAVGNLSLAANDGTRKLDNMFTFCETAFSQGQEILLLITELTVNYYSARFIGHYGCEKYFSHNQELQFYERQQEIIRKMEVLEL